MVSLVDRNKARNCDPKPLETGFGLTADMLQVDAVAECVAHYWFHAQMTKMRTM